MGWAGIIHQGQGRGRMSDVHFFWLGLCAFGGALVILYLSSRKMKVAIQILDRAIALLNEAKAIRKGGGE